MQLIKPCLASLCLLSMVCPAITFAHGGNAHDTPAEAPVVLAPGYEKLNFAPPEPGSYTLPALGQAGDGNLLTSGGELTTLHEILNGKISVLSFIYQACNDVNGCPLATYVLHQIQQKLANDNDLHDAVQLLSVSFDPENDTPEAMQAYRESFSNSPIDWQFLTGRSVEDLEPLLRAYDQSLSRTGEESDQINHVLRVYLIDESLQIRNIFSSSLLHADTLVSDIKTLALASTSASQLAQKDNAAALPDKSNTDTPQLSANDARHGYAEGSYVSNSRALVKRGVEADLLAHAQSQPLGLPPLPQSQSLTAESIALGKQLFFDRRLSLNNTQSCAMCHVPQQGFTVNEMATAVGMEGRTVKRNAPSLLNVGYLSRLFHDGRERRLEQQVWSPLLAHNEMANPSVGAILDKIVSIEDYQDQFTSVFGSESPTMETLGKALADYQRSLVAGNSPFDQWYFGEDSSAVSEQVKLGLSLFNGKAQCSSCHQIQDEFALFTDESFHNTGVGYARSMRNRSEPHPVTLAPGIVVMVDPAIYADAAEEPPNDLGLYEVTQNPDDRWKFRTPSLRNVALSAPYMHNGSINTLEEVIEFYNQGGINNPLLSNKLTPLGLTESESEALVALLHSLTSPAVNLLVYDALATPVGDLTKVTQQ